MNANPGKYSPGCRSDPGRPQVAGIILAAGSAFRMGELKQLLPFSGKPILAHVLDHAALSGLSPLILVLGCGRDRILAALPDPPADVILNSAWESGMASSISTGLEHLDRTAPDAAGAFFLLGDQPLVDHVLIRILKDRAVRIPDRIVIPTFLEKRGNPVYFPSRFFPMLTRLSGSSQPEAGGRQIFEKFPGAIVEVPVDTPAVCADIDTPEDYRRLCSRENA